MVAPYKQLSDEEVLELRQEKVELNRKSRRQTGMKKACVGKTQGLLECETSEGRCPDYEECRND